MRDLRFYFFGHQCPHNSYLIARINNIAAAENVPLSITDFTDDEETCRRLRIFSPTMLLVNEKHRLHGPFTAEQVKALLDDEGFAPTAYAVAQSDDVVEGDLIPVTPESVLKTCVPCIGSDDSGLCRGKSEWIRTRLSTSRLPHLGYLHLVDNTCVGGVEFLPSTDVPYPIPDKGKDNAFLTCSYISHDTRDVRTHPLMKLVDDLRGLGFATLSVAASRGVVFPNGPTSWFERKGFVDKGPLITEELHRADIRYLQLPL